MPINFYTILDYQPLFGRDANEMKDTKNKIKPNRNNKGNYIIHLNLSHTQALQLEIGNKAAGKVQQWFHKVQVKSNTYIYNSEHKL